MAYEWIPSSNANEPSVLYGDPNAAVPALEVDNHGTSAALKVVQSGVTSASTSTGGSINVDNSLNTGAGLVVYSTQAAPTGRLIVARANSTTFTQAAMYAENAGTGHALQASQTAASSNATGSAANLTSSNPGATCVQVSGVESGRGSIKVTHTNPGPANNSDANASALSVDLQPGAFGGTAAQGVHIDATAGGTSGALLDIRNNGNQLMKVLSDATFAIPSIVLGNGGPTITIGAGAPAVAAPVGSLYLRTDGGAGTTLYVKESGTGTTGWVAK